jgi:hypothetical protein
MNQVTQIIEFACNDQTIHEGYNYSGYQMYSMAVNFFGESFDIGKDLDMDRAYKEAIGDELFAYYCAAVIQKRIYYTMMINHTGPKYIIEPAANMAAVWEAKLHDKINAISQNREINHHGWLH